MTEQRQKTENRIEKLQETQKLIQENIDRKYHTIKLCFDQNDLNDKTVIQNIQQIAADLEEYFRLSSEDPDYQISFILEYIIKGFRTRGFPESKWMYVYEALSPPQYKKYKRILDLSSSQSLSPLRKRKEDSSVRTALFKQKIKEAYALISDIGVLERDHHQDCWEYGMDAINDYQKDMEKHNIPITNNKQQDIYDPPKDESKEAIKYPEMIPCESRLTEALDRYWQTWKKVRDIVYEEGKEKKLKGSTDRILMVPDEETDKIAEAFHTVCDLLAPVLDRKWRMDHLHWFDIIRVADEWFKHTGSTASKVQDFYGRWRAITREHVGARKENMKPFFDKTIQMVPHYFLFFSIWMAKVRIKQGAEFSGDLGPKLSESSMR